MLKRLHLRNFTVFEDADFEFGPGLNVIVGTNGTGKSHVLKVGYATVHCLSQVLQNLSKLSAQELEAAEENLILRHIESLAEGKFKAVFQPVPYSISLLNRNGHHASTAVVDVELSYLGGHNTTSILLSSGYISIPSFIKPAGFSEDSNFLNPVFIPAKEVLTMSWLLPMYTLREVPIDQTYPDLLQLLPVLPLKLISTTVLKILERLQHLIGGKVEEEGGRFYLAAPDQPRMEMNLVAEGMRKFATLYKLLANGTLTPETTLFWDEPEANLNPALLKEMAAVLTELARAGFQIILATHSLFLLKELHILSQKEKTAVRYFGLSAEAGGATQVATADSLTDLPNLVALDVEMAQSDTFLDVLNQADANV